MKKCKECNLEKELSEFYKHPQWVMGTLPRCKDCIKKWRKTEREREMARINDLKRSKSPKRIAYSIERTRKYRQVNPEKWNAHKLVNNFLRKNYLYKPSRCSICGSNSNLHYHHFDYSLPNMVISCCARCHKKLHSWLSYDNTMITILPF